MNSILASFAMIRSSIREGEDYLSAFIPLILNLLSKKSYKEIEIETVIEDFIAEYGLVIPRHPMETILNKLKPKYLSKSHGKFILRKGVIQADAKDYDIEDGRNQYRALIDNFIDFCVHFDPPLEITEPQADQVFVNFLMVHDLEILALRTLDEEQTLFPSNVVPSGSDAVYLLNRFVNEQLNKKGEYADYLINVSLGHYYANTILIREFANVRAGGTCKNYYLDSSLLFDIVGVNGEFRRSSTIELVKLLQSKGSKIFIFSHTKEEFLTIINNCIKWIDNPHYDPEKASPSLSYFKENGFSIQELQSFSERSMYVLKKLGINIFGPTLPNYRETYQIGHRELKDIIKDIYSTSDRNFDIDSKEETIDLDIKSIEYIYQLRGSNVPISLNNADHVFISPNASLALASRRYESEIEKRSYLTIPAVLTDVFVGTLSWTDGSTQFAENYNRSKLIYQTSAAIKPHKLLLAKFLTVLNDHSEDPQIYDTEELKILIQQPIVRGLLSDITLNDPDRITASTPLELFERSKFEHQKPLKEENSALRQTIAEKEIKSLDDQQKIISLKKENISQSDHLNAFINKLSELFAQILGVIVWLVLLLLNLIKDESNNKLLTAFINVIILIPSSIIWTFQQKINASFRTYLNKLLIKSTNSDD